MLSKVRFLIRLNGHRFCLRNSAHPISRPAKFSLPTGRPPSGISRRSLSNCVNQDPKEPQESDLLKNYSLINQKIREQLKASHRLDGNANHLLNKMEKVCAEIKLLQEQLDDEESDEMRNLIQDDLSKLSKNFDGLKNELIERLFTESYLTDELTMEFENGVGGNEAMIFTKELVNFYTQYCRKQDWVVTPVDLVQSNGNQ